jgi:hypothetical protein
MIDLRLLISPNEVDLARKLIYQDYFINRKWFPTNNLSGVRIEQIESGKIFVDDYDDVATWFGAFLDGEIIGCCRLCRRINGTFELERYHYLPEYISQDLRANELNRYATHQNFTDSPVIFPRLIKLVVEYSLESEISIFSTTGINSVTRHTDIGFEQCDVPAFKFSDSDGDFVHLVFMSNDIKKKKEIIRRCVSIIESYQ